MKKVFYLLVALAIFMLCASAGYELSTRADAIIKGLPFPGGAQPGGTQGGFGNNACLLSIQVDRLDVQRPRLVSAWVTYLNITDQPYKINFLAIYFPNMASENAKALAKNFELDDHGAPGSGFWRAFSAYKVACKDYIMIDEYGVVTVLNWINGRSDMESVLKQNAGDFTVIKGLLEEACDKITGSEGRPMPPFHWTDLAPGHIRTNLTMDTALLYWERAVNAPSPETCSVSK